MNNFQWGEKWGEKWVIGLLSYWVIDHWLLVIGYWSLIIDH
jgi:hypothetical protein